MTESSWKHKFASAAFFLALALTLGTSIGGAIEALACGGACGADKAGQPATPGNRVQKADGAGCCCCAAGPCRCGSPERPPESDPAPCVFFSSAGKGQEESPAAFLVDFSPLPQRPGPARALKAPMSGAGPPVPLFLIHLALLC